MSKLITKINNIGDDTRRYRKNGFETSNYKFVVENVLIFTQLIFFSIMFKDEV